MDRKIVADKVIGCVADHFSIGAEKVSETTAVGGLNGWDSTTHVSLILGLEETFGVEFDVAKVGSVQNVGDIIDLCSSAVSQQA
ncbi:MAG: acyl carrier protein [Xanthobacteraceae bacterium]|nr:acyl carrier protein [Xanthobacteraceae bacterium]